VDAGYEVAFACSPSFRPQIEAAGFDVFPAGTFGRAAGDGGPAVAAKSSH
jgi:UDP:flavonoid glycosyltransferase YjiC (YdhE family)